MTGTLSVEETKTGLLRAEEPPEDGRGGEEPVSGSVCGEGPAQRRPRPVTPESQVGLPNGAHLGPTLGWTRPQEGGNVGMGQMEQEGVIGDGPGGSGALLRAGVRGCQGTAVPGLGCLQDSGSWVGAGWPFPGSDCGHASHEVTHPSHLPPQKPGPPPGRGPALCLSWCPEACKLPWEGGSQPLPSREGRTPRPRRLLCARTRCCPRTECGGTWLLLWKGL